MYSCQLLKFISGPRCIADTFEVYLRALGNEGDFYRRPLANTAGELRYGNQPVGVNKLGLFMKEIAQKGGLKGNFTNHSGKRSCATQLYHAGVPEQEIMARTGHRSEKAVRKYKRSSDEMLRQVSGALDPNNNTQGAYTGHRYENTVTQYKKCSNEMLKEISGPLGPNINSQEQKQVNIVDSDQNKTKTANLVLSDLTNKTGVINFSGCTFNF